ncbi:DNA-binding protein [Pseudomonas putida]|uniref:Cointegrate resolution protein T n=1 Tax=Pseudomonas putida TaxID=303 RepID=A0AAD0L8R9_PSEPU|nr:DNA-binding protein [Pseudomonas putida]AXA24947.1 cointegrate resolution protein T [Pseudomonas putida]
MARGGIDKAAVQQARQALIARGEHPSIDAVRIELGNTGSKTTIHRYMRELEALQPLADKRSPALSDTLGRFVGQLAEQLREEAEARIRDAQAVFDEQRGQLQAQLQLAQQALAAAHQQQQIQASALAAESEKLETALSTLQTEQLRSASLNQSLGELRLRLTDKDEQLQQSQGELRQLQQDAMARQEELTHLHRENERLLTENRQASAQYKQLDEQFEQRDAQVQGLRSILAQAQGASEEVRRQLDSERQALVVQRDICAEQMRLIERLQDRLTRSEARCAQLETFQAKGA